MKDRHCGRGCPGAVREAGGVRHEPRRTCSDFAILCDATAEGIGIAYVPDHVCAGHVGAGKLVHVFQDWQGQAGIVHLVFTTRRGLARPKLAETRRSALETADRKSGRPLTDPTKS